MVRSLGLIELPETKHEKVEIEDRAKSFWEAHHREAVEPFRDELIARIAPANLDNAQFTQIEAVVVARTNIAAELYPDVFKPGSSLVDKDGLTDYRALLQRMKQLQPGVFHDPDRDLLLFAHRFFRRNLSHRNKLNTYFLKSFIETAKENDSLRVRIKLDPDLIGHPNSLIELIELEYWRGPIYNDDISTIPSGVAEHKADERTRFYEGIDRTQIWWKVPERRHKDGLSTNYRTFEVEELIENPSGGLNEDQFGCRYAHAEFSEDKVAITHFDGAIRAYEGDSYLERIERSIDRAGKHSDYNKVFRLDGTLTIPLWKRLLTDFFKGNNLLPEYLGDSPEEFDPIQPTPTTSEPTLAALISLQSGPTNKSIRLCPDQHIYFSGQNIPYVEIGVGSMGEYLSDRFDLRKIATIGFKDGILNLSRLNFGALNNLTETFNKEVSALVKALCKDIEDGLTSYVAIPLTWNVDGLLVTLTLAGEASKVAKVLAQLPTVIIPTKVPSEWIEALAGLVQATAPSENLDVMWSGVKHGVLAIDRPENAEYQIQIPKTLIRKVSTQGKST